MKHIKAKTPGIAWKKAVKEVLKSKVVVHDGEIKLIESLNVLITVSQPTKMDAILKKHADIKMIKWMFKNFFSKTPIDNWGYSYCQRITDYMGENQIKQITDKLRNNKETKSATLTLSLPPHDKKHAPCVNIIDFKFRKGQLNATVFIRSQDAGKKIYADIICIGTILENLAIELGLKTGELLIHVVSLHIYSNDLIDLEKKFPDLF